jgi:hypothetical protein
MKTRIVELAPYFIVAVIFFGSGLGVSVMYQGSETEEVAEVEEVVEVEEAEENEVVAEVGVIECSDAIADVAEYIIGFVNTEVQIEPEAMGFSIGDGWGRFRVNFTSRDDVDEFDVGEDRLYRGSFSSESSVTYHVTDPNHIIAREGYVGDAQGYVEKDGEYYLINTRGTSGTVVPETVLVGEVELANGKALLLQGPEVSDGPSPYPNTPGVYAAILNTPNGLNGGGVFIFDSNDADISLEDFTEMLSHIELTE